MFENLSKNRYYNYYSEDDDAIAKYSLKFYGNSFRQFCLAVHCYKPQSGYVTMILYKKSVTPIPRPQCLAERHFLVQYVLTVISRISISSHFQRLEQGEFAVFKRESYRLY